MTAEPELVVLPDADALAAEVASQLVPLMAGAIEHARAIDSRAALGLTAGSIMEKVWAKLAASSTAQGLDWAAVDVLWGDERFVPAGSDERNDVPAERILFAHEPFAAARRFSMPASDGPLGDDLDAAADSYASTLFDLRRPVDRGVVPHVDVMLLGVGPDGHCCSLFPDHPGLAVTGKSVIAVRNSPKPPPSRISLSFEGLNSSEQIWVVASGSEKADAVAAALGGADRIHTPSAGARGRSRTVWFVDSAAAAKLPA